MSKLPLCPVDSKDSDVRYGNTDDGVSSLGLKKISKVLAIRWMCLKTNLLSFEMKAWFWKIPNFDFQNLILKYFINKISWKKNWVDIFTKNTVFIVGSFHVSHV